MSSVRACSDASPNQQEKHSELQPGFDVVSLLRHLPNRANDSSQNSGGSSHNHNTLDFGTPGQLYGSDHMSSRDRIFDSIKDDPSLPVQLIDAQSEIIRAKDAFRHGNAARAKEWLEDADRNLKQLLGTGQHGAKGGGDLAPAGSHPHSNGQSDNTPSDATPHPQGDTPRPVPRGIPTSQHAPGEKPSWADLTAINNNNGGIVAPAYFAREISADARLTPAHLGNLKFEKHGAQYDEGLMVDTRTINPNDLETIKMYEGVNTFESNQTTGKYLGSIQIPKGMQYLRQITDYGNGLVVSTNSTATIIQPDGKEINFAKAYIGPNDKVGAGQDVLIGTPVGHTGWFGNEGAITTDEAASALRDGTAPEHALDLYVPVDVLSKGNKGVTGPAKYADVSYAKEYNSSDENLKLGSLLAIPKNVSAEQLGLKTEMGKAVLASFEKYGAYIADTTHEKNAFGLDTTAGVKNMIAKSGQEKAFEDDINKIIAAADVVL